MSQREKFEKWYIDHQVRTDTKPSCWQAWQAARESEGGESLIEWSEHRPGNPEIPYDHVVAETPFGRFEITWKGWKEHDIPTVDETPWGDYLGAFFDVAEAKSACEQEYARRLKMAGPQPDKWIPEGWKLVPCHADAAMIRIGKRAQNEEFLFHQDPDLNIQQIWKAMIAFAPTPPKQESEAHE